MGANCAAWLFKVCTAVHRVPVLSCPVLSLFTVEGNGRPQDHPQCTVWIYSEFHPWCRYEVNIAVYIPKAETLVCCEMLFMLLNAARSTMSFCRTSPEFWRTSAPSRAWKRTLTWKCLRRCWKRTYLGLLKSTGERSKSFCILNPNLLNKT